MKIHEFQAKKLFAEYGIPVPSGAVATTAEQARLFAETAGGPVVVKAQIHAGGRGKGGGVKPAATPDEAHNAAGAILGMNLVTPQTGPEGRTVKKVLVEQSLDVAQELYLGIVIDRALAMPVIMACAAGGINIEEVAAQTPEKIIRAAADPAGGLSGLHSRKLAFGLGLDGDLAKQAADIVARLYRLFIDKDCSLIEINPLVITADRRMLALDAKAAFDDDALFRHQDIMELFDPDEQNPIEIEAVRHRLSYIKLDGNVGCMVNGAGLAMATMDIIKVAGAEPANFLDVGGGASAEQVEQALRILMSDASVKAVLINIFGGILRCDRVAAGIIAAAEKIQFTVPVVVRFEGTNVEQGKELLRQSGLHFELASSFGDAAQRAARLAGAQPLQGDGA
jgi:succinyl-CoA synthetase beta subunit